MMEVLEILSHSNKTGYPQTSDRQLDNGVSSVALRAPSNTPLHNQFRNGLPSFASKFTRLLVATHIWHVIVLTLPPGISETGFGFYGFTPCIEDVSGNFSVRCPVWDQAE
jgi:hypothetical protein